MGGTARFPPKAPGGLRGGGGEGARWLAAAVTLAHIKGPRAQEADMAHIPPVIVPSAKAVGGGARSVFPFHNPEEAGLGGRHGEERPPPARMVPPLLSWGQGLGT